MINMFVNGWWLMYVYITSNVSLLLLLRFTMAMANSRPPCTIPHCCWKLFLATCFQKHFCGNYAVQFPNEMTCWYIVISITWFQQGWTPLALLCCTPHLLLLPDSPPLLSDQTHQVVISIMWFQQAWTPLALWYYTLHPFSNQAHRCCSICASHYSQTAWTA